MFDGPIRSVAGSEKNVRINGMLLRENTKDGMYEKQRNQKWLATLDRLHDDARIFWSTRFQP
jgi:hypothetical protein